MQKSALIGVVIVQIVASIFLKGGIGELMSLFYTLQIIVSLTYFDNSLPANIDEFTQKVREIVQFDFLTPDKLLPILFPDFDMAESLGFTKDQMESSLLFSFGAYISILLVVILLVAAINALRKVERFRVKASEIIE